MTVCLFALMIVVLIYCVLSIVVILINIILVMSDIDYYYYLYSLYVATLYIEHLLPACYRCKLALRAWSTTFRKTRLAYFEFDWQPFSLARAI